MGAYSAFRDMPRDTCLSDVDVIVLAGGLGTRIKDALGETPKILAPINGQPFLDYLIAWLSRFGASRVTLCLGHLAGKVVEHLKQRSWGAVRMEVMVETEPLGTGGALRRAQSGVASDRVLVMNGDTWLDTDLCDFLNRSRDAGHDISILCVEVDDASRYGRVEIDSNHRFVRFIEKDPARHGSGVVSAGVYSFSEAGLRRLETFPGSSLERDCLQSMPAGSIYCHVVHRANFIDIGTPESLRRADAVFSGLGRRP